MSKILKLYERAIGQRGQSDEEFELSKALYEREQNRLGVKICKRADGSLFTRKIKKKIDTICVCPICENEYVMSTGKAYTHNYGGTPQKKYVCSQDCLEVVFSIIPASRLKKSVAILG